MIEKNNPVSESESDVLDLIQEESAEIIQIISKVRRFGWDSFHPSDAERVTTRARLESELGDILALIEIAIERNIVDSQRVRDAIDSKKERLKIFSNLFDVVL